MYILNWLRRLDIEIPRHLGGGMFTVSPRERITVWIYALPMSLRQQLSSPYTCVVFNDIVIRLTASAI